MYFLTSTFKKIFFLFLLAVTLLWNANRWADNFKKIKANAGGFSATMFDNWVVKVSFDKNNIPDYFFFRGSWQKQEHGLYIYKGDDSHAGNFSLSKVEYILSKGKNPFFEEQNSYNKNPNLKQFYFYSFQAVAAKVSKLESPLMAVDTHSKLVFAFARPKQLLNFFGKKIPQSWMSFEAYYNDFEHKFYEFDPIGWVSIDGKVYFYDWFKQDQINETFSRHKSSGTIATPNKSGRSPYAK